MTKNNRSAVLALAAALSLMVPQALAGDFDATAARTKLAELIAYVRDGPAECGETRFQWTCAPRLPRYTR